MIYIIFLNYNIMINLIKKKKLRDYWFRWPGLHLPDYFWLLLSNHEFFISIRLKLINHSMVREEVWWFSISHKGFDLVHHMRLIWFICIDGYPLIYMYWWLPICISKDNVLIALLFPPCISVRGKFKRNVIFKIMVEVLYAF